MSAVLDCPKIDCWRSLLDETLSREQRENYEVHLESCPVCQERIDRAQECQERMRQLGRRFGDPTIAPADPLLDQVRERLHEVQPPIGVSLTEAADLFFLRPADREDVLGLLGDYEVREVIGQGGMGVVLKAFDPALHRLVAIKVMSPSLAGSVTARRRFTREARSAAAVIHDHVVAVHGVHETEGLPYLVMQYIEGESLQARLDRSGPLELVEIVRISLETALGLAAAHAQGLIHRDVKPANLLLSTNRNAESSGLPASDGTYETDATDQSHWSHSSHGKCSLSHLQKAVVKITDFGLARMIDDVALTQNGVVAGTPEYMSPEQARGEAVDHRSDLFSLGSVIYAMCTGVPPFRVSTAMAVLRQVSAEEPVPLQALNPKVPAWLESVVNRLMKKTPAERFQTAAEVVKELEGYLAQLPKSVLFSRQEAPFAGYSSAGTMKVGVKVWLRLASWLLLIVVLIAVIALANWLPAQNDLGSAREPRKEFYQDFRGGQPLPPSLRFSGPDADEVSKPEAEGLRITLPADRPVNHPVEVVANFGVSGDFEITASYQLLSATRPDKGYGVGVSLNLADSDARSTFAKVGRVMLANEGSVFQTEYWRNAPSKDYQPRTKATNSRMGQLRLVRTGPSLRFLVADGLEGKFEEIYLQPLFGTEDMANVRFVVADSGRPGNAVDARLVDLRIRSSSPLPESSSDNSAAVEGEGVSLPNGWVMAAELVGLLLASSLSVVAWLAYRRRRGAQTATASAPAEVTGIDTREPLITFTCSGCAKKLKTKASLAGKRIKCPNCGETVHVLTDG